MVAPLCRAAGTHRRQGRAGRWRELVQDAADARYAPTGHLVFLRQGTLWAVAFDLTGLEIAGTPFPVTPEVQQELAGTNTYANTGAGQFALSQTGTLVYARGPMIPPLRNSLVWVDRTGTTRPVAPLRAPISGAVLSPDGGRIAYASLGGATPGPGSSTWRERPSCRSTQGERSARSGGSRTAGP